MFSSSSDVLRRAAPLQQLGTDVLQGKWILTRAFMMILSSHDNDCSKTKLSFCFMIELLS